MELGKDPGLGVRQLQAQGITGSGVGIAIIDQPMLVDHQEYASRLKLYEEINIDPGTDLADAWTGGSFHRRGEDDRGCTGG